MTKESIIIIDSSKRNQSIYPSNNNFVYNTTNQYTNPSKIELLSAIIPNSQYVINSFNNLFNLTYSSTLYTSVIPPCNYTASSLAVSLQTSLNRLSVPSTTFTVTVNLNTMTYTITSTNPVVYNFSLNPILSQILGFGSTNSSSVSTISSKNAFQVSTSRYWKLYIKEFDTNYDTNISGLFNFIILNNVNNSDYLYMIKDINCVNNSHEINIRRNITTLSIELRDEWNNLVDLNGCNYLLILKIYE